MSRIATSVFDGAATDNLAAVDIYKEVSDEIRTSFTTKFTAFGQDLADSLGLKQSSLSDFTSSLTDGLSSVSDAKERLENVIRSSRSALADASEEMRDRIYEDLGYDSGKIADVQLLVDGAYHKLKNGDITDANAVAALLSDITGNDLIKAIDVGVDVAALSETMRQLNKWGLTNLIDSVMGQFDNQEVINRAAKNTIAELDTSANNISAVEALLRHVTASVIVADQPDLPASLLRNYSFETDVTSDDYPALLTQLVHVMGSLKWDWISTRREGVTVWNHSLVSEASEDALTLLLSEPTRMYHPVALVAPYYPTSSVTAVLKMHYPQIAIA